MYEFLVTNLRNCAETNSLSRYKRELMKQAADAIEGLEKDLERSKNYETFANKPRWIPVTEQLPKKGMRVLCACRANIFCVLKWDGIDWVENQTHVYMRGFVTHWMLLPEPPKEET